MEQRKKFIRTRGLPQAGSPMLLAAIALLAVGAILLLVSDLLNEYSSGGDVWSFLLALAGCAQGGSPSQTSSQGEAVPEDGDPAGNPAPEDTPADGDAGPGAEPPAG